MNGKKIGEDFETAVSGIVTCYLAEAETNEYPFLVYDQFTTPVVTKDGIEGFDALLACTIYGRDPDEVEDIAGAVSAAVMTAECMQPYGLHPETIDRDCNNGIWEYSLAWNIHQNELNQENNG